MKNNSKKNNLRFFWNGIKVGKGSLQRGHYTFTKAFTHASGKKVDTHMTIYARDFEGFSKEVWDTFRVDNDTCLYTDYHDKDKVRVEPDHPMFKAVAVGFIKQLERDIKRQTAYDKKHNYKSDRVGQLGAELKEFKNTYSM